MAALRLAARKVVGGQRAAPAVVLTRRLVYYRPDGSIARPGAAPSDKYSAVKVFASRYTEFHEKRDELYDVCVQLNKLPSVPAIEGLPKLCEVLVPIFWEIVSLYDVCDGWDKYQLDLGLALSQV